MAPRNPNNTPIHSNDETDAPMQKGNFQVQILFAGIGVVPFNALHCDDLSDVLMMLHREDPLDQYFDAISESGQRTRVYLRGVAAVTERTAATPQPTIIRPRGPVPPGAH